MSDSLISILMPVRNASPFLKECLDSVLGQTETKWELIAVNNHSTDNSSEIIKAYTAKDARIRLHENAGKGLIQALRTAYAYSTGDLITRMDADDIMPLGKLETLKMILRSKGLGHIATGKVSYFSKEGVGKGFKRYEKWLNELMETGGHWQNIYRECVIPSPCWMVFRDDFERCGAFLPEIYPEDYDLCFRFFQQGLKVEASTDILHKWRDYSSRASRTDPDYADNKFLSLKMHWFTKISHQKSRPLVVWGAGSKGKWIAGYLKAGKFPFTWVTNNERKIGVNIYGITLSDFKSLAELDDFQIIIAVASPEEQEEIRSFLNVKCSCEADDIFFFC